MKPMDNQQLNTDRNLPLLEFKNITVVKGEKKVLDSVSITISEGENIAILGPNGAGKSSFIKTVTREYYPYAPDDETVFRIWGHQRCDVFDIRALLGIVSNDLQYTFNRSMSGREVILSGFFSSVGLFRQEVTPVMDEKADSIIRFLDIDHIASRPINRMSSGEARRFLIGRALIHEPRALILDEPTNSLDLHALHTFRQTLRKIARSGTAIILVTHNLHDIIPEIGRVILMKDGTFWKDGEKKRILTTDNIGELFSIPVHVKEENGYFYATGY